MSRHRIHGDPMPFCFAKSRRLPLPAACFSFTKAKFFIERSIRNWR